MKKSKISRRKFLSNVGLTAGAAVVLPKGKLLKTFNSQKAVTASKGKFEMKTTHPVRTLSRPAGSHLLPMAKKLL